jgi:hypothetical protein
VPASREIRYNASGLLIPPHSLQCSAFLFHLVVRTGIKRDKEQSRKCATLIFDADERFPGLYEVISALAAIR